MRVFTRISFILFLICDLSFGAPGRPPSKKTCAERLTKGSRSLPEIEPVVLKPMDRLSDNPNYQFEMKYDGFRGIGYFEHDRRRFVSRQGITLSQFQPLCEAIARELGVQNAIFDGEVIAADETGRPIFERLLRRQGPFQYVAFDLLWLNGEDLRSLPLEVRRKRLLEVLPESSRLITESLVQVGSGLQLYKLMVKNDLEGIVVKRLSDKYSRATRWYKFKNRNYSQAVGRSRFFKNKGQN